MQLSLADDAFRPKAAGGGGLEHKHAEFLKGLISRVDTDYLKKRFRSRNSMAGLVLAVGAQIERIHTLLAEIDALADDYYVATHVAAPGQLQHFPNTLCEMCEGWRTEITHLGHLW